MILSDDKKQVPASAPRNQAYAPTSYTAAYSNSTPSEPNESTGLLAPSPPPYTLPNQGDESRSRTSSIHSNPFRPVSQLGPLPSSPDESGKPPSQSRRGSPARRFCAALSIALLIVFVWNLLWAVPEIVKEVKKGNRAGEGGKGQGGKLPVVEVGKGGRVEITDGDTGAGRDWQTSWDLDAGLLPNEQGVRACLPIKLSHTKVNPFTTTTSSTSGLEDIFSDTNDKDFYSILARYVIPAPSSSTPADEILTFLHTRGYNTGGSIRILSHEDAEAEEFVGRTHGEVPALKDGEVGVMIRGWSRLQRAWDDMHVCRAGSGASQGVVIVREKSPPWIDLNDSIHLDIFVRYSEHAAGSPQLAHDSDGNKGGLEVIAHNFGVELGAVRAGFGKVDVSTTNGAVKADALLAKHVGITSTNGKIICEDCCPSKVSLRADSYDLHTTNAMISGHFCAKQYISGSTTSGRVEGTYDAPMIGMRTTNGAVEGKFTGIVPGYRRIGGDAANTGLWLSTTNGKVDVSYTIDEPAKGSESSTIKVPVSITSTNNAMHVTALTVPIDVTADTILSTTNGRIEYNGYPTFQGDVLLTTSSYQKIDLSIGPSPKNVPERYLRTIIKTNGALQGSVVRKGEEEGKGKAVWSKLNVHTSNAPIHIVA